MVGGVDAQLGGSAEQQALGVGNQRTEVCHGAYAQEDETGINTHLHTDIQDIKQTTLSHDMAIAVVVGA